MSPTKAQQTDFHTGSVYRNILAVGVPMTIAQVLNLLYNIVDRIYIGRIPGEGALALTGVGLCFPVISLVTAFSSLYGQGGAPLCSMARGRGDHREAEWIIGNAFTALLVTGAALTAAGLVFHRPILYLFGASDATFPYARDYITVYLLGTLAVMVTLGMNPFINSQGFGRIGMLTVLLGAVTNIILDPILIFGLDMGIRGAALATIISQFLSAAWVLRFLTGETTSLRLRVRNMRVQWARLRRICALGVTGFIMAGTNALVQIACNTTLQRYGGDLYVGVMTVLGSIRDILHLPVQSMSSGASPVLSFNYGEGAFDRVKKGIFFNTACGLVFTLLAWAVVFAAPGLFIRIFNNEPSLVEAAIPALRLYFFGFVGMAFQNTGQTVFVALGKARQAVFFSLLRKAFIVVPLTFVLPMFWGLGVNGVFLAEPVSNVIGPAACYLTMMATVYPELNGKAAKRREAARR